MTTSIGDLGEQLVSNWLQSQSYRILNRQWRCRWGEIDIIAEDKNNSTLVFVEVKTRNNFNWDNFGLEAISINKQQKISRSAALFLSQNIQYNDFYIRFDVAGVRCQKTTAPSSLDIKIKNHSQNNSLCNKTLSNKFISNFVDGYYLQIIHYLENAFEYN